MRVEIEQRVLNQDGEPDVVLAYAFAPHDDGLSLFVSCNLADEWHIRLRVDEPQDVASQIANFVKTASS